MHYRVGEIVEDQFELLQELGIGGQGEVFRARYLVDNKEYALKFAKRMGFKSVQREFGPLKALNNENIVKAHWAVRLGSHDWVLVTDFVEGESLASRLDRDGALSLREVAFIGDRLLNALSAMHSDEQRISALENAKNVRDLTYEEFYELSDLQGAQTVHQDIKPANVMLREDGRPVLIDFGIADRVSNRGETVSYTPGYVPPDGALAGAPASTDRDRYALGIVLLQCLTAIDPVERRRVTQAIRNIRNLPNVDPLLVGFFKVACASKRSNRFETTAAMVEAWRDWERPAKTRVDARVAQAPARTEHYTGWTGRPLGPCSAMTDEEITEVLVEITQTQGPVICADLYSRFAIWSSQIDVRRLNRLTFRAVSDGRLQQFEPRGGGQQDKTVMTPGTDVARLRRLGDRSVDALPTVEVLAWRDYVLATKRPATTAERKTAGEVASCWLSASPESTIDLEQLTYLIERRLEKHAAR